MRAILVSVDYTDLLALTLPHNRQHFSQVVVVTSPEDYTNVLPVAWENGADIFATDAFYRGEAKFNKWAALEEGLDWMGRSGWLCLMDADVVWPKSVCVSEDGGDLFLEPKAVVDPDGGPTSFKAGQLVTPLRRMLTDLSQTIPMEQEDEWRKYPVHQNVEEWAGYSQIFHASDPVLRSLPWHEVDWKHAGGADSYFQIRWARQNKVRPAFEVLHLGPTRENWCGRATPYLGGAIPENAHERKHQLRAFLQGRAGKTGKEMFAEEKL